MMRWKLPVILATTAGMTGFGGYGLVVGAVGDDDGKEVPDEPTVGWCDEFAFTTAVDGETREVIGAIITQDCVSAISVTGRITYVTYKLYVDVDLWREVGEVMGVEHDDDDDEFVVQ